MEQGETDDEGMQRLLKRWLGLEEQVAVSQHLSTWWRPGFETFIVSHAFYSMVFLTPFSSTRTARLM